MICGTDLGAKTVGYDEGTYTYTGPCNDVFLRVKNGYGNHGVTAAIQKSGETTWHPTILGQGTCFSNPTDMSFFTDPAFDYSAWTVPVSNTVLVTRPAYIDFKTNYGGDVWTYQDGAIPAVTYYYRMPASGFC